MAAPRTVLIFLFDSSSLLSFSVISVFSVVNSCLNWSDYVQAEQVYVTHCLPANSVSGRPGFEVRAASVSDPLLLQFALEQPAYELPLDLRRRRLEDHFLNIMRADDIRARSSGAALVTPLASTGIQSAATAKK